MGFKSIGGINRLVSIRDLEIISCLRKMVEHDGHMFPSHPQTAFHHGEPAESCLPFRS
jgi:hypothetical protein